MRPHLVLSALVNNAERIRVIDAALVSGNLTGDETDELTARRDELVALSQREALRLNPPGPYEAGAPPPEPNPVGDLVDGLLGGIL